MAETKIVFYSRTSCYSTLLIVQEQRQGSKLGWHNLLQICSQSC
uniref:Uncharacterized protein n=1 Tax=Populus trichocarpa TaxID=3694 RepID=A0A3N7F2V9_POPTR